MLRTVLTAWTLAALALPGVAGTVEAPLDARRTGEAKFAAAPKAEKAGDSIRISFEASAATDVEVAVLDAKGAVVRHLAAGLLGRNAPEPFKKDALAQVLVWDGRDDAGKPPPSTIHPPPFRVRVRLGSQARLEQVVGRDDRTMGGSIAALSVGPGGELFVLLVDGSWGRSELRAYGRDGRYLRTVMPYSASTPKERAESIGQLEIDGHPSTGSGSESRAGSRERLPMVFSGHGHAICPMTAGMKNQSFAWHPKGYLVMTSAVGTMSEHGPPRHLLAMDPRGGAPEGVDFVGPEIMKPRGGMQGAGEAGARFFDHLATSPDGEYVYFTLTGVSKHFKQPHAVFRAKWSDKECADPWLGKAEAGDDDAHFNDPQGVAVDRDGRVYVCDRGNGRVMLFSAEGKPLGRLAVENPEQIAVHRSSGEIYILCRPQPALWADTSTMSQAEYDAWKKARKAQPKGPPKPNRLLKFAAWKDEAPRELARLERQGLELFALDQDAAPAKLWAAVAGDLCPLAEKDGSFDLGEAINNHSGLKYPWFVAGDPDRNRVLVRELSTGIKSKAIRAIDLTTGAKTGFLEATEVALDRQGNIYATGGWASNAIYKFDPEGKALALPGSNSNRIATGAWTSYGPDAGLRGHCVDANGDIYMIRAVNHWGWGEGGIHSRVDVFGPDGKKKRAALVDGLSDSDCGIGVDASGNVYLGINVKPAEKPFPPEFMGRLPAGNWYRWSEKDGARQAPWCYPYCNPYLFFWGSVFKFGPEGGAVYGLGSGKKPKAPAPGDEPSPLLSTDNAPAGAAAYRSGYLNRDVKIAGARWRVQGMGIVPTTMAVCPWGDPACGCLNSRLAVDPYGRVYSPDVFRFSVGMLDVGGNLIAHIGRYGNADDGGARDEGRGAGQEAPPRPSDGAPRLTSPAPRPICFAWPAFVSEAGGRLFVSDPVNRQVTVVTFDFAAEETCELR